ncbi:hypothetical protein [Nonomuraea sp. NPDC023979]|uniref:hypothetical protein n=1 Tax=Nonomuraea sp. NPDC023979 TaxID=3154796 RepID=UPI0033F9FA8B
MPETPAKPSSKPTPAITEAEKAGRKVMNRYVREGLISRSEANRILKFALPFVPSILAQARLNGRSPEWLTNYFQHKRAEATRPAHVVAAEVYLAMWAGLQVDYANYVNETRPRT